MRRAIRCVRLRRGCSRRCAPLPSRRPRTGSSPRSPTAGWSRSTPTAAACARCAPAPDAGQITELAWSPGGNRLAFVKAGEIVGARPRRPGASLRSPTAGERDDAEPRLVAGRHADRASGAACCALPASRPPTAATREPRPVDLRRRHDGARLGAGPRRRSRSWSAACCCSPGLDAAAAGRPGMPAWAPDGSAVAYRATPTGCSTRSRPVGRAAPVRRRRRRGRRAGRRTSASLRLRRRRRAAHGRARDRRRAARSC